MAKELTCEILKDYGKIQIDENFSIVVSEVKWGGRQPKGYDIRRYSEEEQRLGKGITIPYDAMDDLVKIIIDNGLCNIENIEDYIKKRKDKYFTQDDFMSMFSSMNKEMIKYRRDKYGMLRNDDNLIVITSRNERKRG